MLPIKDHLGRFEIPNADNLFYVVLSDFQRANTLVERCFVLGDFALGTADNTGQVIGIIN